MLKSVTTDLLNKTRADRTTIRLEIVPGDEMLVLAEARQAGVTSLEGRPAVREAGPFEFLEKERRVLVQDDVCTSPPTFPELADLYGVRAQMLAPIERAGRLAGIVSVHSEGIREWSDQELGWLKDAAQSVDSELRSLQDVVQDLLTAVGVSRCTLRQNVMSVVFPVINEALADGVGSLRGESTVDLSSSPVVAELQRGKQVVQRDCQEAFVDEQFQRMLDVYGGLRAQVVTPVFVAGDLAAIVSLHHLHSPRKWSDQEISIATEGARQVQKILEVPR